MQNNVIETSDIEEASSKAFKMVYSALDIDIHDMITSVKHAQDYSEATLKQVNDKVLQNKT